MAHPDHPLHQLTQGEQKPRQLTEGEARFSELYLVYAEADYSGPAVRRRGELLLEKSAELASD